MNTTVLHTPLTIDNPHVKVVWIVQLQNKADLEGCRISDTEYKRIPTIELLFSYYGSTVGQHFQLLCRVVCSGVNETQVTRNESVYSYLENQLRTSTNTNTKLRGVRSTTSREKLSEKMPVAKKAHINKKKTTRNEKEQPVPKVTGKIPSKLSKKAVQAQRMRDTKMLNELYYRGELPAMKLYFDSKKDIYYSCLWDQNIGEEGGYTKKEVIKNIGDCVPFLVEVANRRPNEWVGPPAGAPGDGEAPEY